MVILEVINGEYRHPVEYASPVADALDVEVERASQEIDLEGVNVKECVSALQRGDVWWHEETHCFCCVSVG